MRRLLGLSFLSLSIATGCGYQFDYPNQKSTITVPFIFGDPQGELTTKLIYLINASGKYTTTPQGARYLLCVRIIGNKDQNVGFRYDRNNEGELLTTIIPAETRLSLLAEVELIDTYQSCTLVGPARISASYDFDHDWYSTLDEVNVFSLGQITDYSDAKDQVYSPLYQKLAQKIVDLLLQI